ncbi:MAG: hypothetical protein RLZZ126_1536 [Pseudomonadota bacterium]
MPHSIAAVLALCAGALPHPAWAASPTILVVGDSLSAEYGLARGTGWVALLDQKLAAEKRSVKVVNASISGDTTSGGLNRIGPLLKAHQPQVVVVELGGNDALRGLPLAQTRANLAGMATAAQKAGARVLLVGMQVPPNYGAAYAADFAKTFTEVAKAHKTALVPFFLAGLGDVNDPGATEKWFQPDRIHPKAEAHPIMLGNVWPELRKLLK